MAFHRRLYRVARPVLIRDLDSVLESVARKFDLGQAANPEIRFEGKPLHNDYSFWLVEVLSALRPFPELARQVDPPLWRKLLRLFRSFRRVYREDILRLCALLEQAA